MGIIFIVVFGTRKMNPLVLDCETTTFQKGNPYAQRNKLCVVGGYDGNTSDYYNVEYDAAPYGAVLDRIKARIKASELLIFFNAKFDICWLRRYGIQINIPIWDLQYAHFCITGQEKRMPSLNEVLAYYGLPLKKDIVKEEYWDKGIDTPEIPSEILREYTIHDCVSEYLVFLKQIEYLKDKPQLKRLIWTGCKDILVTQEMEWNGLKFDVEQSSTLGDECLEQIKELDKQLYGLGDWPYINWNSGDHLSSVLYGGPITEEVRQTYQRTLKRGDVVERSHWVKVVHQLPRLVQPDDKTKLKKEGFWSTDEKTLKSLSATGIAKEIIRLSLERSKIEKKVGTYFHGFPKLYKEMDWADEILHGQLNHCVTKTGRLSSSKPNQQNLDEEIRKCIITRFSKN